jgi:hypothetical protein
MVVILHRGSMKLAEEQIDAPEERLIAAFLPSSVLLQQLQ